MFPTHRGVFTLLESCSKLLCSLSNHNLFCDQLAPLYEEKKMTNETVKNRRSISFPLSCVIILCYHLSLNLMLTRLNQDSRDPCSVHGHISHASHTKLTSPCSNLHSIKEMILPRNTVRFNS